MMEHEMGLELKSPETAPGAASSPAVKPQKELIRISISDPKTEKDKIQKLYDQLRLIKRNKSRDLPASYQQFSDYIAAQIFRIRSQRGCSSVAFTIAQEEDAIRFIAVAENL